MNTCAVLAVSICSMMLPLAAAAQVHKCSTPESIVYRDTPCAEGHTQVLLHKPKSAARAEPAVRIESQVRADAGAITAVSMQERPIALPAPGTAISLGMTDLEVLNLRGWGRPSKIARSKVNGVWREQWSYTPPAHGPKPVLQFVNARLAAIETEPAESPQQQAVRQTSDAPLPGLVRVVVTDIAN